jgi:hypothetical protein
MGNKIRFLEVEIMLGKGRMNLFLVIRLMPDNEQQN